MYHYQIKKCRRAEEKIKKNKFLDMCLNVDVDLFQEIKKMRNAPEHVANIFDGDSKDTLSRFIVSSTNPWMMLKS